MNKTLDNKIPSPSKKLVEKWLNEWNKKSDYIEKENAINRVFSLFQKNDKLEDILIKCSVLNDFYSTNIFNIYEVAKHIKELQIDERLENGESSLVNEIATNKINGKNKNFYSFATKYCSHHKPEEYPIYDQFVSKVLCYFRKKNKELKFFNKDLKDYTRFKEIIDEFRKCYGLEDFTYKQIDMFLWQFGKFYFK